MVSGRADVLRKTSGQGRRHAAFHAVGDPRLYDSHGSVTVVVADWRHVVGLSEVEMSEILKTLFETSGYSY